MEATKTHLHAAPIVAGRRGSPIWVFYFSIIAETRPKNVQHNLLAATMWMLCSQDQHRHDTTKPPVWIAGIYYTRAFFSLACTSLNQITWTSTDCWRGGYSSDCSLRIRTELVMHLQKCKAMSRQEERMSCSGWDPLTSQLEWGRPLGARMM